MSAGEPPLPAVGDQPFSLLSSTGWNSAVAFLSSAAGSAPLIMLVSAMPKMSRNSVTGTMIGRPGCAMLAEVSDEVIESYFAPIGERELRFS